MKTYYRILTLAVLPALLMGCSKGLEKGQENNGTRDGGTRSDIEVLSGNALKGVAGETTKTYLTMDDQVAWSDGDQIRLIGATAATVSIVPLGNDATHGFLQGSIPEPLNGSVAYTALYPATMFSSVTSAGPSPIAGTLPKEYNYADYALNPLKCFPMLAKSSNKVLDFEGVLGLLEIALTGEMTVDTVEVSTTSTTKHLAGAFTINPTNRTMTLTGTDNTIIIGCGTGVKLNGDRPTKFYVPLVPGTYENIKVKVRTKEMISVGGSCEHTVASLTVEKGMIYASAFKADRDAVQLWPGGPYWATCNIGAFQPQDYGSKYMWGMTTKIYSNPDRQSGSYAAGEFTFLPGFEAGAAWTSYAAFDGDGTGGGFSKYVLAHSTLSDADDAATVLWKDGWRMPTAEEYDYMIENCPRIFVSTTYGGVTVKGWIVKSLDEKSEIFLPTASSITGASFSYNDAGYYWSKSLWYTGNTGGYDLHFNSTEFTNDRHHNRCMANSIRPVHD